jgi:hypothetical protein
MRTLKYLFIQFPERQVEMEPITQAYFNLDSLWDDKVQQDEYLESKLKSVSTRISPCSYSVIYMYRKHQ